MLSVRLVVRTPLGHQDICGLRLDSFRQGSISTSLVRSGIGLRRKILQILCSTRGPGGVSGHETACLSPSVSIEDDDDDDEARIFIYRAAFRRM
jgi:hypothetical protein